MKDINSLNKVMLIGRLGGKPEIRYLPQKDRSVARFSLATNERFINTESREAVDRTEWHRIVVWGKLAEFCEKYLSQGRQVLVEGKLRTRSWQDKTGAKRTTTEIEAFNIILLGKREESAAPEFESDGAGAGAGTQQFAGPEEDFPSGGETGGGEDDVPF